MRALSAILLCAWASPALAEDISCNPSAHQIEVEFRPADVATICPQAANPQTGCRAPLAAVNQASKDLHQELARACQTANQVQADIVDIAGQNDAPKQESAALSKGIMAYQSYLTLLKSEYNQIVKSLNPPTGGPLVTAAPAAAAGAASLAPHDLQKQQILAALKGRDTSKVKNLPVMGTSNSDITDSATGRPDAGLFASVHGANYLKKILDEVSKTSEALSTFNELKTKADESVAKVKTADDPDGKKEKPPAAAAAASSGLDMKTLAGLATAGAGLAGMLQKKDAGTSANEAGATSPTPDSGKNAAAKEGPTSSKFGSDKGATAPVASQPAPKKDAPATSNRVPSGSGYADTSDISKGLPSSFGASTSAPATGKSSGGGGAMAGSGGGSSAGGESAAAAVAAKAAGGGGPDDTQGIGGGSLGGGGPPSMGGGPPALGGTDPTAGAPASAEDSMKDLLHEMKETAEGPSPGELQASAADVVMSAEDLFPRISAAYQRIQKQGRVLDGLAEKITEENQ